MLNGQFLRARMDPEAEHEQEQRLIEYFFQQPQSLGKLAHFGALNAVLGLANEDDFLSPV